MPAEANLNFLNVREEDVRRWDQEWCRYICKYEPSRYFTNLSDPGHKSHQRAKEIPHLNREQMYDYKGPMSQLRLWIDGADLAKKTVLEFGCGPSQLGRDLATVVDKYIGLDYSELALHIADVCTPENCFFISLRDKKSISFLRSIVDTIVCRHFFIHQNYENARWLLNLAKFLLKEGGIIVPDFYWPASEEKHRDLISRDAVMRADAQLQNFPSTMFHFSEEQIQELARQHGFRIEAVKICEKFGRRICRMTSQ